ncbi:MAG: four helix bundle protein [Elainellaceae cyanobacterium]
MEELPIIQKTYDLIRWYVPILNRLPRDHRFGLGVRMVDSLYGLLEGLIQARYTRTQKLSRLEGLNTHLDILKTPVFQKPGFCPSLGKEFKKPGFYGRSPL